MDEERRKVFNRYLAAAGIFMFLFGAIVSPSECFIAYAILTILALTPSFIWVNSENPGLPIFPVMILLYYIYYAMPLTRSTSIIQLAAIEGPELVDASYSVMIFMLAAIMVWAPFARGAKPPRSIFANKRSEAIEKQLSVPQSLISLGLLIGVFFFMLSGLGGLNWMGSTIGTVRQVVTMTISLSCFLFGYSIAERGKRAFLVLHSIMVIYIIIMSWSSLFLVGGIFIGAAGILGYVIKSGRVPIAILVLFVGTLYMLHSVKDEMREKYWIEGAAVEVVSPLEAPFFVMGWLQLALNRMTTAELTVKENVLERASLLHMVAITQLRSPPFLEGATYAHLPEVFIPRFLNQEKVAMQISTKLLSVHFGIQSEAAAEVTAIGWGLIAEAYANFANIGVLTIGAAMGLLAGVLSILTANSPHPLSIRFFIGVASLLCLMNLEVDLTYLVSNLWQSLMACFIIYLPLKAFNKAPKGEFIPGIRV